VNDVAGNVHSVRDLLGGTEEDQENLRAEILSPEVLNRKQSVRR
jgi:hypothetical protein